MIRANPPASSGSLRVPFLFVPDGAGDPPEVAQFKADYPGWVRFRARFRPRPGSQPRAAALLPIADVEEQTLQPQARPGQGPRQHGAAPAAPGLAMRGPPPCLPAHHAPPAAYTGPQALMALMAQASIALSPAGRAALIRSTQAMLDAVAGRAAALAVRYEILQNRAANRLSLNFDNRQKAGADANNLNSRKVQIAQNIDNFGKRIAAWSGPNMTGIGIYDFGGIQIIVNTGQRIPPPYLPIENPMIQNGHILNDNRQR